MWLLIYPGVVKCKIPYAPERVNADRRENEYCTSPSAVFWYRFAWAVSIVWLGRKFWPMLFSEPARGEENCPMSPGPPEPLLAKVACGAIVKSPRRYRRHRRT